MVIATLPSQSFALLPAWRQAMTRIALGVGAQDVPEANYAVEGDGAALASELTAMVTERRRRKETLG